MRKPASTENEMLLREIEETEAALAEASGVLGCTCIIDPTESLGDRVRHLAMIAILATVSLGQLQKAMTLRDPSPGQYSEMLRRLEEN